MLISVVNLSSEQDEDVQRVLRAINVQIQRDFEPYWHMGGRLRLEGKSSSRASKENPVDLRGDAILYLVDSVAEQEVLGFHESNARGVPYGIVYMSLARELGEPWSATLSHEALELIADPTANVFCAGPHPEDPDLIVFHWYEVCDAVQTERYDIDGVLVSNFVLPLYFTPDAEKGARNDFLNRPRPDGSRLESFGINPGGYVGFFDPKLNDSVTFARSGDETALARLSVKGVAKESRRSVRYKSYLGKSSQKTKPHAKKRKTKSKESRLVAVDVQPRQWVTNADLPTLDSAGISELKAALVRSPAKTMQSLALLMPQVSVSWTAPMLLDGLERLEQSQRSGPSAGRRGAITLGLGETRLPPGFSFEGMTPEIPIDPSNCQFEETRDALGWVRHAGAVWALAQMGGVKKVPFRWATQAGQFDHRVAPSAGGRTSVALFSDFGTGLYHSRYIARHIRSHNPALAFHLGDVYYAGRKREFRERFASVLEPMLTDGTQLFALNANHEMFSGGRWYFDYLDQKRARHGQLQASSYFAVKVGNVQFLGLDTDYHASSRCPARMQRWLKAHVEAHRGPNRINVLLTSNEPYTFGKKGTTALFKQDLKQIVESGDIDLWFWGNTHYCALFDRRDSGPGQKLPFIGSCIGHGGFPYDRMVSNAERHRATPTSTPFLEVDSRFAGTNVRPDRGNNGFALLHIEPDAEPRLTLEYIDWQKRPRFRTELVKRGGKLVRA